MVATIPASGIGDLCQMASPMSSKSEERHLRVLILGPSRVRFISRTGWSRVRSVLRWHKWAGGRWLAGDTCDYLGTLAYHTGGHKDHKHWMGTRIWVVKYCWSENQYFSPDLLQQRIKWQIIQKTWFFSEFFFVGPQEGETPPPLAQMVLTQCTSISELLVHHMAPPGGQI